MSFFLTCISEELVQPFVEITQVRSVSGKSNKQKEHVDTLMMS